MNAKKMNKMLKSTVAVLSVVLVICLSVAGTLTYLQDKTTPVVNTFSPSNIDLDLTETPVGIGGTATANTYKMIPGVDLSKDPVVDVTADIDCYVFVKVEESDNFDNFMTYAIAGGWKLYGSGETDDEAGIDTDTEDEYILYREVTAAAAQGGASFEVLAGNVVTVKSTVTKGDMEGLGTDYPKLTLTAYAIQKTGFESNLAGAWNAAQAQQG